MTTSVTTSITGKQEGAKALFRRKNIQNISQEGDPIHGSIHHSLKRTLGVWDLTAFGVAAIIGAGIFSTVGNAAFDGGPAVILLFIFTAFACAFSAMCYAEFASAIPIAGSAYTYAYATFGELFAWIIGWDLLMEYAIGNIAVAISWGNYFTHLLESYGLHIPSYLTLDYLTASRAHDQVATLLAKGIQLEQLASQGISSATLEAYRAWSEAPILGGIHLIANLPAFLITLIITSIVYIGIEESRKFSNLLVLLKVTVVLMVIILGAFYVHPVNWSPFAPNGISGVLKGVSAVFFAYIGFDAISTTAEECKNPQHDLPRGMIYSLLICTVLYVLVSLVLTGMVNYKQLNVGDPLAFVFGPHGANLPWVSNIIAVSAIVALSTVMLVFQLGQPRIWMVMSRDGLLPPIFSAIHPKYRTPWFSTLVAGFVVGVPSLFMNLTEVTELTSIGTLFAFVLVCGGVLRLERREHPENSASSAKPFRIPYVNSQWIFPALCLLAAALGWLLNSAGMKAYFSSEGMLQKLPFLAFLAGLLILNVLCILYRLSLIPVLGLVSCGYLMTELGVTNWVRFGFWLAIGLVIYFVYGFRNSRLGRLK